MTTLFFSGQHFLFFRTTYFFFLPLPTLSLSRHLYATFVSRCPPFNKAGRHRAWNNWIGRRRRSPCLKVIVPVCSVCCSVVLFFSVWRIVVDVWTDFAQLYLLHWAFRKLQRSGGSARARNVVREVLVVLVGGTRCVTFGTENNMNNTGSGHFGVLNAYKHVLFLWFFDVPIQGRIWSLLTFFFIIIRFDVSGICLNLCCPNDPSWKFVNLPTVFFVTDTDPNENGRRKSGRESKQQAKRRW